MTPTERAQHERVVILAPIGKDAHLIRAVLREAHIQAESVASLALLCYELSRCPGAAIVAEDVLADGGMARLRSVIDAQPPWCDLPILILANQGANSPIAIGAMETLGNVTLLERPLQRVTLVSAVRSALRASARQHQIRAHLIERDRTAETLRQQSQLLARDIAVRKRMEATLRHNERLYRGIGESIDYGVWIADAEGHNTYVSDSLLQLVGARQSDLAGLAWIAFLHPDERDEIASAWRECVAQKGDWDREYRIRGVDGSYHPVLARGVALRDEAGTVTGWSGIHLDIGRLRRAQETLREADRRKDEFLATLAHELRNPLAPISSAVAVMTLKGPADPSVTWARDIIDRQVRQLRRLVDDLLDVSRITQGKVALQLERVTIDEVLRAAIDTSQPAIDAAQHALVLRLPPEPLQLDADSVRLSQCISNLLNNAAKYTPRGGRIELMAEREGANVAIRVRDNGLGISADEIGGIFEMFNQAGRSPDRAQGGLGIGLTLVRSFVEMHGGTVAASSAGRGLGSEFVVRLPAAAADAAAPRREPATAVHTAARAGRRVLVVDDNVDGSESLGLLLRLEGNEVRTAHDGERALEAAAEFRPHVVLLDIGMPKLDGYEAARRLREQDWGKDIVLIAVTGWGQESDRRRSREAGIEYHLTKPVDTDELLALLASLANKAPAGDAHVH